MHPRNEDMSSQVFTDRARHWSKWLEASERRRHGRSQIDARLRLATRAGTTPGTLENLRKGRLKDVGTALYERLRRLMIDELRAEAAAHEHEIALLLELGQHVGDREIEEAQTSLRQIRAVLAREMRR